MTRGNTQGLLTCELFRTRGAGSALFLDLFLQPLKATEMRGAMTSVLEVWAQLRAGWYHCCLFSSTLSHLFLRFLFRQNLALSQGWSVNWVSGCPKATIRWGGVLPSHCHLPWFACSCVSSVPTRSGSTTRGPAALVSPPTRGD